MGLRHNGMIKVVTGMRRCGKSYLLFNLFSDALKGLDAVSYGPDMQGIHTFGEKLSVESVQRTWTYTLAVLEDMCPPVQDELY